MQLDTLQDWLQLLDDRSDSYLVLTRSPRGFELGDDQDEIRRFAEAIQEAFMEENN
jgi:hypothetical protein